MKKLHTGWKCYQCSTILSNVEQFITHKDVHDNECTVCNHSFPSAAHLKCHQQTLKHQQNTTPKILENDFDLEEGMKFSFTTSNNKDFTVSENTDDIPLDSLINTRIIYSCQQTRQNEDVLPNYNISISYILHFMFLYFIR
jgi:hypothetical protein